MVADGIACLGPVTQAGLRRALSGLQSRLLRLLWPHGDAQHTALGAWWRDHLMSPTPTWCARWRTYNAFAEAFRKESEVYEHAHD